MTTEIMTDTLSAETPFGIAARIVISRLYSQMMSNMQGTLDGTDIEAVHDMRVASRRLRAALRVFRKCLPSEMLNDVTGQVQSVTRALGGVRDHDVFIEYIEDRNKKLQIGLDWLINIEKMNRDSARNAMIEAIGELESGRLGDAITQMLDAVTMISGKPKDCFAAQAYTLVKPRLRSFMKSSYAIYNPDLITEIHLMRIHAKKLRYTMEAFVPCFGKPLAECISDIKQIQEQLGQIHDCDVWISKLRVYLDIEDADYSQITAISRLIDNISERRSTAYNSGLNQWTHMINNRFPQRVLETTIYKPTSTSMEAIVDNIDEEKQAEQDQPSEQKPEETAEKKTIRRRTPAKKEQTEPNEAAEPEVDEEQPECAAVEDTEPIGEPEEAEEAPKSVETIVAEAAPEEEPAEAKSSKEPQHPGIVQLRALISEATIYLDSTGTMTKKMSKELKKLERKTEKLPSRLRKVGIKDAAKAEKYLFRLRESIGLIPGSELNEKNINKLSEQICKLRRKLPTSKK